MHRGGRHERSRTNALIAAAIAAVDAAAAAAAAARRGIHGQQPSIEMIHRLLHLLVAVTKHIEGITINHTLST